MHKPQRIRDPLHNLIEFGSDEFEEVMWRVIQTRPFQRLRRIKQLGFSDLVYPGATHTRFAHSVGVFHTARQLMRIIKDAIDRRPRDQHQFKNSRANIALAAALVHDLGHGMFSHAFEAVGKELDLKMAHHEKVSDLLIRDSEVSAVLNELGRGFADDVADVIRRDGPGNLYDAVVSSQFDADRLDYMQRDRLMTGVQNSGIDFTWLINNLEIGTVSGGVDDQAAPAIETFVLGPKATYAAETYVLSLFQLYPTVYFHKTTRGMEKMFSALMSRVVQLIRRESVRATGLPEYHPIVKFARNPESLEHALALDDTVFWGSLPLMSAAEDSAVARFAKRFIDRQVLKCIDIRERLKASAESRRLSALHGENASTWLDRRITWIKEQLELWSNESADPIPRILLDKVSRNPYKRFDDLKGPLNQIRIRAAEDRILDMAEASSVVAAIKEFHLFRAYVDGSDHEARAKIDDMIDQALRSNGDAEA